jgi:endonuclease YncB( thermonuclease family)
MKWGIIQYVAAFSVAVGGSVAFSNVRSGGVEAAQARQTPQVSSDAGAPRFTGQARVIDGDTLALDDVRIRLHGIDAPEISQTCTDMRGAVWTCGKWSKAALDQLASEPVTCVQKDVDRYDRIVAACYVGQVDINAAMVAKGAAFAYAEYSTDYVADEAQARRLATGMWRSGVQAPSDYRKDKRTAQKKAQVLAEVAPSKGCAIKGNISKSGRLYHMPGSRWYAGTRINTGKGEHWFCSEPEARAAGWRAARS